MSHEIVERPGGVVAHVAYDSPPDEETRKAVDAVIDAAARYWRVADIDPDMTRELITTDDG